jgi:RHS repeat-associated protein
VIPRSRRRTSACRPLDSRSTSFAGGVSSVDLVHAGFTFLTETMNDRKAPVNPLKFAGEYLDPTGLYHLRARQYDPNTGRFLTADPLTQPLTDPYISSYVYANNRPTVLIGSQPMTARPTG